MTRTPLLLAPLALLAASLGGCNHPLPPAMTLSTAIAAPAPGSASVIFARPKTSCDTTGYTVVVDEQGRFVANVAPGTQVAASVTPGTHAFFGWSNVDQRIGSNPAFNPVAATRVEASPSEPSYVLDDHEPGFNCLDWAIVDLHVADLHGSDSDELRTYLITPCRRRPILARGQRSLEARPARLRAIGPRRAQAHLPRRGGGARASRKGGARRRCALGRRVGQALGAALGRNGVQGTQPSRGCGRPRLGSRRADHVTEVRHGRRSLPEARVYERGARGGRSGSPGADGHRTS